MPQLKRKNGSIFWQVHGTGEPIVMLRGLGRTIKHWFGYDMELAKSLRVVTMDLRGLGKTSVPHGWTDSMFDLADDVAEVLTAAGIDQAHICGVSLGGMVALATAMRHPERCRSVITINSSIAGQGTLRLSVPGVSGIVEGLCRGGDVIHQKLAHSMVGRDTSSKDIATVAANFAQLAAADGMNIETIARQLAAAARFHVAKRLRQCQVPALIVYGTHDVFVPNINSKKIAKLLPKARLVPLEGAGHEPSLDYAAALTKVLTDWVSERANAAR